MAIMISIPVGFESNDVSGLDKDSMAPFDMRFRNHNDWIVTERRFSE